jgi:hypothetical protein
VGTPYTAGRVAEAGGLVDVIEVHALSVPENDVWSRPSSTAPLNVAVEE